MTPTPAKMNPFPGLRPFTQEEDYLFFGREEQTLELLQRLGNTRFVAVVGTSGSGKSSLVRCGLLSELLGGRMLDAGAAWEIAVTHPGGNPLALLTEALLDADLYDREAEHARENLLATLSRSHFGLVEAVKQADLGDGTNFLVVVDQFEEIFRFQDAGQRQQEAANEFVSLLLEAVAQKEVPIYVVLTMRSDFIGECGQFEGLAEMVNKAEFLIPRLTREQYKRVIEGPIKVAGGQIAPRLLQRLLNDLGQQADQLPCLQHALMRTWNVWATKGDTDALDLDDYQCVGKMSQALSLHADEIYESLASDRQRELCKGIFQALTVEETNSRGIRRPQRLSRLCQILEVPADELGPIIDAYRQSGVTFLMPSPEVELTEQTIIDISHESLMRVWTRLRQWVEEETQAAGIYLRLSESADLHEQGKAGLYRDPELGIALAWREAKRPNAAWAERYRPGFGTAIRFLEASQQASIAEREAQEAARQRELERAQQLAEAQQLRLDQQQRAARGLRKLIAGLAVVACLAAIACVVALVANKRANVLADFAKQKTDIAEASFAEAERERTAALQSKQATEQALTQVESQKATVEDSLAKAKQAEQSAQTAEEAGRKLLYTTDMRLAPFVWRDDRSTAEQLRVLLAKHVPEERMKEEKERMKNAGDEPASSFILPTSSFPKPDLRGFEWHYYQHLLEHSASVLAGHPVSVVGAAFAAQDQLVTLDQNGQVRRWDLDSRDEDQAARRDLPGSPGAQVRVLSPDGRWAALAEGNKVHVFDTSTGKENFQIDSANSPQRRLIFSPDGERLVIVDDKVRWCQAVKGEVLATVAQNYSSRVENLAVSADGLTLAVVGHSNIGNLFSIFRLDAASHKVTPLAKGIGFGGTMHASALSPTGEHIAVGAKLSGSLFIYDTATGRAITQHSSIHASPASAMAFSADGAKLATADAEGTIKIWADPQKLSAKSAALLTLKGHQGAITSIAFSSDGKRLVTSSADKTIRDWDLENAGAAIRPLEQSGGAIRFGSAVARFSPDGQLIANADRSSIVRLWDAASGRLVRELPGDERGRVASVAFSPTDTRLLAVGYGGQTDASYVALWDIEAGAELARLPGATDLPDLQSDEDSSVVGALAFSPDGKFLVAGFGSKNMLMGGSFAMPLKVWDVATRRLIRRLNGHLNFCMALDFSKDGTLLASGSRDGTAILWSTATWKAMRTLQNPDQDSVFNIAGRLGMFGDVAFSPDGKTLAVASREGTVQLWDVSSGKLLESLKGHSSAVHAVAFSPDGRTLASGSGDQTVRLWNMATRRELMQLDSGSVQLGQVQTLAFSPEGSQLLAGGSTGAVWSTERLVWNDSDRAAEKMRNLLLSKVDFQSRIRMLSENLGLHAALAKLDAKEPRVAAALAATQANWHASRQGWPEAVAAYDRLKTADPKTPEAWLRMPGVLRLATALVQQDRARDAAVLLQACTKYSGQDPAVTRVSGFGIKFATEGVAVRIQEVVPGSPAARVKLLPGDVFVKVNGVDTTKADLSAVSKLMAGEVGTKLRLTVRHAGQTETEEVELVKANNLVDETTVRLVATLQATLDERLTKSPQDAALLELHAELAGQDSDFVRQLADYTAAIETLAKQNPENAAVARDRGRLHRRRADAYVKLQKWDEAVADYARGVTKESTDEDVLANAALANAEARLVPQGTTVAKPVNAKSLLGATLSILPDDSILASGENPLNDKYRVDLTIGSDISLAALRLEVLTDTSLPGNGPGRLGSGNFAITSWNVIASSPGRKEPITLVFDEVHDDRPTAIYPIGLGHWNIAGSEGKSWNAIWSISNPVSLAAGTTLTVEMQFKEWEGVGENLGHFRLSLSSDPATFDRESKRIAARKLTDPWQKLAAAYRVQGDQAAIDQLVDRHPKSAGLVGDLFTQGKYGEADWPRAIAIYSRGITAETTDVDLLAKRARAYEGTQNWDAAAADWSRAAAGNPDGAKLRAEFARRAAAGDQVTLAKGQFEESQTLYERSLQADPESDLVATDLALVLADRSQLLNPVQWTVLQPTEMKSDKGATLTRQEDGSILASGTNIDGDVYTISARSSLDRVAAIRLEVLPDPSLPHKGPGRHETGAFHLRQFRLYQSPQDGQVGLQPVTISSASASYSWNAADVDITGAIDPSLNKFWHVWGRFGQAHQAVFRLQKPILSTDRKLVIELRQGASLGRFRLSVCEEPGALETDETRVAVQKVTDPWAKLAAGYALNGRNEEATQKFAKALQGADGYEARKPIVELAARFDDILSGLVQRLPDDPQLQLAMARKLAQRGQDRLTAKQPAEAVADLQKSRDLFARVRDIQSQWTVLKPAEMTTAGGATLTLENDGSIFVSGNIQAKETYTVEFVQLPQEIQAIRLEALRDDRLPSGGPGTHDSGNFILSDLTVYRPDATGPAAMKQVPLRAVFATFEERRAATSLTKGEEGWSVHGATGKSQSAFFATDRRQPGNETSRLRVVLDFYHRSAIGPTHALLGRFRLSVTSDGDTMTRIQLRNDLREREVADLYVVLAKGQAELGQIKDAVASFAEALQMVPDRTDKVRIIAAAAALAAPGSDQSALDDAEKATLRRQALQWMTAELAEWNQRLESATPQDRLSVIEAVSLWNENADLASLREQPPTRAALPEPGQQVFARVWSDVAALMTKAETGFRALPAAEQVEAVRAELKKRNPETDALVEHTVENGRVAYLKVNAPGFRDLSPIRALPGLQRLHLWGAEITDLSPLNGMNLTHLWLYSTRVSDLSPLRGMKLRLLDMSDTTKVADLSPLAGMPLEQLTIQSSQVSDLTPLKDLKLTYFNCDGSQVTDLSPLKNAPLTGLLIHNTKISDLTPIRKMPLTSLIMYNSKVSDLSPLQGMPVTNLQLQGSAVTDLSPLVDVPLTELQCDFQAPRDARVLRAIKTLVKINTKPTADFWKELDRPLVLRLPAVLRGEDKPANNAERLDFARSAYDEKQFASAALLWAEALDADPKAGDDRLTQIRYQAARAAVLAAAGQGQGELPETDAAKAKLRRQALGWLQAELTAWTQAIEAGSSPTPTRAVRALTGWTQDSDRAGLRDPQALARLPAAERKAWRTLWTAVAAVTDKAALLAQQEYERLLEQDSDNRAAATQLARCLLDQQERRNATRWMVLQPTDLKSEGGATLKLLPDGSILSSGKHPNRDDYILTIPVDLQNITAIALDILPHESHDGNVGRGTGGGCILSEFEISLLDESGRPQPVVLKESVADYEGTAVYEMARYVIDGQNDDKGWGTPQNRFPHRLVVKPEHSIPANATALRIVLRQNHFNDGHKLGLLIGRFRLWATDDPRALEQERSRFAVLKLTDPWIRLAAAYAATGQNDAAARYFGQALNRATSWADRKAIIEHVAQHDELLILLGKLHPDDPQVQLALARSLSARGQAALAAHRPAEALSPLQQAHAIFAQIMPAETAWFVLKPVELSSVAGAKLELQSDGSVFVRSQTPPKADTYTLVFPAEMPRIAGLRLEALADPRLPNGGSGWAGEGNFVLSELTLQAAPAENPGRVKPIALRNAIADFNQQGFEVGSAIDGNGGTGWAIAPQISKDHTAVFDLAEQAGDGPAPLLTVQLSFQHGDPNYKLGRFRLAFTADLAALQAERVRLELARNEIPELYVALAKAYAQEGQSAAAVAKFARAIELTVDRADRSKIIAAATLAGVLDELAERAAGHAQVQAELAQYFVEQGQQKKANAARATARTLFEAQIENEPENSSAAAELADLLLSETQWSVLNPTELKSAGGATLTLQPDGSILASGTNPDKDSYQITAKPGARDIRALRLEALPDPSLGNSGPGRAGNFVLTKLEVVHQKSVAGISRAAETYAQDGVFTAASAVDRNNGNGWAVWPKAGQAHSACFQFEAPVHLADGETLSVNLYFGSNIRHTLGRFRLSVSDEPAAFEHEKKRMTAMMAADPWGKLATAYDIIADQSALEKLLKRHPAAAAVFGDQYAADKNWNRAVAEYNKVVTPETKDADLFAKRAEAYEKLVQWKLAIADWGRADELVANKNRRYGNYPSIIRRAQAYDSLKRFDNALADYDRAVDASIGGLDSLMWRKEHWAKRARWAEAIDDYRQVWNKRDPGAWIEWHYSRERAMLNLITGDMEAYRQAVTEMLTKTEKLADTDSSRWQVLVLISSPGMITDANRDRLIVAADRDDAWQMPRQKAAMLFRRGEFQQAADLFDQNPGGIEFELLAAMAHVKLQHPDRARQLFQSASSWIQQSRDNDPGCGSGVPRSHYWAYWALLLQLQREAARQVYGSQLTELDTRLKTEPKDSYLRLERARRLADLGLPDEALADLAQIASAEAASVEFFSLRGRVHASLNLTDSALADLNRAIDGKSTDALVYATRGKILGDRGQTKPARADLEKSLQLEPTKQVAGWLANLLLEEAQRAIPWTVIQPEKLSSENGEQFTVAVDGSIFVSGPNPQRAIYTLRCRTTLPEVAGLRIETLPDARFTERGAGRNAGNGNFHLAELALAVAPQEPGGIATPIEIAVVVADDQTSDDLAAANIIDGNPNTRWDTYPRQSTRHAIVVALKTPVHTTENELILTLDSGISEWGPHGLGRFRVTLSDDPAAFVRQQKLFALTKVADPWSKLAAAYQTIGDQSAFDKLLKSHPAAAAVFGDQYAEEKNWDQAIAAYNQAITPQTKDAKLLAKRAEACEHLMQWDLALSDWTRASQQQHDVAFERFKPTGAGSWGHGLQNGGAGSMEIVDGTLVITTTAVTESQWDVQAIQAPLRLENGAEYVIRFQMKSPDSCPVSLMAAIHQPDWNNIGLNATFIPPIDFKDYEFTFVVENAVPGNNAIKFDLGSKPGKVMVKGIVILKKSSLAEVQSAFDRSLKAERWNEAAVFGLQLVQRKREDVVDDTLAWLRVAPVLALADDHAAYSDFCNRMIRHFADSDLPHVSERIVKAALLRPNTSDLATLHGDRLAKILDDGTAPDSLAPWAWCSRALWAYRSGDAASAVKHVAKSEEFKPAEPAHAINLAVLALAEHQLQHPDAARRALTAAQHAIQILQADPNKHDHDLLIAQILFREAENLINGKAQP